MVVVVTDGWWWWWLPMRYLSTWQSKTQVEEMDVAAVSSLLEGLKLGEHVTTFRENLITGIVLTKLDDHTLEHDLNVVGVLSLKPCFFFSLLN